MHSGKYHSEDVVSGDEHTTPRKFKNYVRKRDSNKKLTSVLCVAASFLYGSGSGLKF
jgi:hypothetical protein